MENKLIKWIESNRFKWWMILMFLGIILNIFQFYLLGHDEIIKIGISVGIGYGILLIIVDHLSHN